MEVPDVSPGHVRVLLAPTISKTVTPPGAPPEAATHPGPGRGLDKPVRRRPTTDHSRWCDVCERLPSLITPEYPTDSDWCEPAG